jgi:hypothetical protein
MSRRRALPRSVSLALMGSATCLVAVGLTDHRVLALSAVLALAAGWASLRIARAELADSRRSHARDRAAQTRAFGSLLVQKSFEQVAFATEMTERLAARERQVVELEGTLRLSERRAAHAEERIRRTRSWESSGQAELDTVVDLLAWEDRSSVSRSEPSATSTRATGHGA